MNYEKLTPERFTQKLKAGEYKILAGARRAIGKADWSSKEKEKAHEVATKHFGASPAPAKPAAKTAKKAAKKAVAKKTAAPAAAAKSVRAPKTSAHAVATSEATNVDEDFRVTRAPRTSGSLIQTIQEVAAAGDVLTAFVSHARQELREARQDNPKGDFTSVETRLTTILDQAAQLVAHHSSMGEASLPVAKAAVKDSKKASSAGSKEAVAASAPSTPALRVEDIVPRPNPDGPQLTAEEESISQALRNSTPASGITSLPRPVVVHTND